MPYIALFLKKIEKISKRCGSTLHPSSNACALFTYTYC